MRGYGTAITFETNLLARLFLVLPHYCEVQAMKFAFRGAILAAVTRETHPVLTDAKSAFAWRYRTKIVNWDDPPAEFQIWN